MIEWLDDSLPNLAALRARKEEFDLVMLTAVWMHLDEAQRELAMPNVSALVRNGATVIMSVRHGPIPPGRRMFEVSAEETIALAQRSNLFCTLNRAAEVFVAAIRSQLDTSGIPKGHQSEFKRQHPIIT